MTGDYKTEKKRDFPKSLLFSSKNTYFMGYRYLEETLFVCLVLDFVTRSHCKVVKE